MRPVAAAACPAPDRSRRRRWSTVAIALVALSPFAAGVYSVISRGFSAGALFGDRAVLALTASDAWRAPALLGPYSRFYWHHPGPLYFYVLNAVGSILGGRTMGFVLAATLINVAAAGGILLLAHRRGGRPLLVWASVLVTAYLLAIEPIPFDIWNPSVTLIPFALVLLLAWSVAVRDWWTLPWLVLVASFVVQTHIGLVPGVAVALAYAVVVNVWRQRRGGASLSHDERSSLRRAGAVSLAIAFVVWLPPVIEQFTSSEGNLTLLLRFFTRPGSPHTLSEGLNNTALQATLMLRSVYEPVSLRVDAHQGLVVAVVLSVAVYAGGIVLARKAGSTDVVLLLVLVALELVGGVYAVTHIAGPIQFYLVQWISAVGFVLWLAAGNACLEFARTRLSDVSWPRALVRGSACLLVAALCVGAVRAASEADGRMNDDHDVSKDRTLFGTVPVAPLLATTRHGQTLVLRLDTETGWEVMAADAWFLVEHGRKVQIIDSPVTRLLFDDSRLVDGAAGHPILAFRDRPHLRVRRGETLVADQGEWSIVGIGP